jgi:hypothetical protein
MTTEDQSFDFEIDDGIEIPAREITGRPSGSQYPLAKMNPGQSFFLTLAGTDGATRKDKDGNVTELTAAEDLERQMRQKQSYFSQLGKKLGISIKTRTYDDGKDYNAKFAGKAGIGVWHGGERVETEEEEVVEEVEDDAVEIAE